jgi:hypothetical protein
VAAQGRRIETEAPPISYVAGHVGDPLAIALIVAASTRR